MDSAEHKTEAGDSHFGSNFMRKRRYEYEDLSISPPDDSSGFFPLRFGPSRCKPHESMYDRINKELGIEGPHHHVAPGFSLAQAGQTNSLDSIPAQLLVRPNGIYLKTRKDSKGQVGTEVSLVTDAASDSPKIIFPATILEELAESPEKSRVAQQNVDELVKKASAGRPTRKTSMNLAQTLDRSFLEGVHNIKIEDLQSQIQPPKPTPHPPGAITSIIPTVTAPAFSNSPNACDRRRKTSAPPSVNPMLMENQKASNYFFTGSLFASSIGSSNPSLGKSAQDLASQSTGEVVVPGASAISEPTTPMKQMESPGTNINLAETTSLMEAKAKEAAEMEPKGRMGKRRPRASALREMNFLAPQSM